MYIELEKQLRTKALDELGIDYKVNKQDLIEIFKDYTGLSHDFSSDETAIKEAQKFGIDLMDDDLEKTKSKLKSLMSYQLLLYPLRYDKVHNLLIENDELINQYLNTENGIKLRHKFLQDISEQYDLIYQTDLFEE